MRLSDLSNDDLLSSLRALLRDGYRLTANVVAYLAEVDERRLYLERASPSLHDFCTRQLGMSDGEACRRITAARLVARFPILLDAIADGRIHLSNLVLLRDVFTAENVEDVVAAVSGKSKREVEQLVERWSGPSEPTEERFRIQLMVNAALNDKIERARALLSHANPSGDLAVVVDRALELLIAKLERDKLGKTERPRTARAPADPADIPRAVRREVADRDGAQCSFVSAEGERCPAKSFLEFDHCVPRARGGTGDAANVRLLCRSHNRHAAEQVFGRAHVERHVHLSRERCKPERSERATREHERGSAVMGGHRDRLHGALVTLGFRSSEAKRAIAGIDPASWDRPVEALLREAIGALT